MIPYIETPRGDISTFSLCVILGMVVLILLVHMELKRSTPNYIAEEDYIFPKIVISGMIGYLTAGIFDSLFKLRINGGLKFSGITFYGGLIGAVSVMYLLLSMTHGKTGHSIKQWFDLLTLPFITFHFLGRIGCFLGGCCYGKTTESILGIVFPDNAAQNIFHHGQKCYPTQLFEATALLSILVLVCRSKNKFSNYVLLYSVARFVIEFFRGDQRGSISTILSPSQVISILLFISVIIYKVMAAYQHRPHDRA